MAITLNQINRLTLRTVFLPYFRQTCAELGITLPPDWNPDDAELERLAEHMGRGLMGLEEED